MSINSKTRRLIVAAFCSVLLSINPTSSASGKEVKNKSDFIQVASGPSKAYVKRVENWARNLMVSNCDLLPSRFSKYQFVLVKSVTDPGLFETYFFRIDGRIDIKVFVGKGVGWRSFDQDRTLWKKWGCDSFIYAP